MSDEAYRETLRCVAADLKERWRQGAPKGDAYGLGFNAGLWNALLAIEQAAEDFGIDLAEIGLADLDIPPEGAPT